MSKKTIKAYEEYLNTYNEPALINLAAFDYFLRAAGDKTLTLTKKDRQELYDYECKRLEKLQ